MKNNLVKMLLTDSRNAFTSLHNVLGLDFEKPYGITHKIGKYTVNQIVKTATAQGYKDNDLLILLTRDNARNGYCNRFHLVTISNTGAVEIDYKVPYMRGSGLDTFYAKKSFEEVRKSDTAETFVIWQDREYLKVPAQKPVDLAARYKLLDFGYGINSQRKRYICRLALQKIDAQGEKFDFNIIGHAFCPKSGYPEKVDDAIDKSGYLVKNRRDDLKRRAAALRAEREKAAFQASDNCDKVKDLEKRLADRKAEIVKALEAATTSEEFAAVEKSLARWHGFAGTVSDFERFKEKVEKKSFASIADCEKAYEAILDNVKKGA